MYSKWIDTLQSSLLFRGIDNESLNIMLDCLKPKIRRCKQRELIVAYGQPFQGVGIIASGKVSLTKDMYSGNRIMMGILDAGDIFGETVAFSDHRVWPMTVIAQEDSCLLFLPPDKITSTCSNICASHSTLIMNMFQILSNRASMLNKKIDQAEKLKVKEDARIKKEKEKAAKTKTTRKRKSTAQNPIIKVLTSATFIRSVFGILKRVMK